jgi:hypothetical protein
VLARARGSAQFALLRRKEPWVEVVECPFFAALARASNEVQSSMRCSASRTHHGHCSCIFAALAGPAGTKTRLRDERDTHTSGSLQMVSQHAGVKGQEQRRHMHRAARRVGCYPLRSSSAAIMTMVPAVLRRMLRGEKVV